MTTSTADEAICGTSTSSIGTSSSNNMYDDGGITVPPLPTQPSTIATAKTTKATTPGDVLLYIPNLIGYVRVLFASTSFIIMLLLMDDSTVSQTTTTTTTTTLQVPTTSVEQYSGYYYHHSYLWRIAILLYISSFVGDLFDGIAARKYNQCSTYGGVLDMITDRCSTAGLLFVLACQQPHQRGRSSSSSSSSISTIGFIQPIRQWFRILFLFLLLLDISSHWVQMYSSLILGSDGNGNGGGGGVVHHKSDRGNKEKNFLVQWYYKYYWFFGYLCVGAELTYILIYVLYQLELEQQQYQQQQQQEQEAILFSSTSQQIQVSSILYTFVVVLLGICIPGMIAKQVVNIAQLCSSLYSIAKYDAIAKNTKKTF